MRALGAVPHSWCSIFGLLLFRLHQSIRGAIGSGIVLFASLVVHAAPLSFDIRHLPAEPFQITRLDYLLSDLAVQRVDGTWVDSRAWFAFVGTKGGRAEAEGIPPGEYRAIRFRVGVDHATNAADPHRIEPGHALHPEVNKLHWGWQGGYVFLAIEGRNASGEGFSYHVARDVNLMTVETPVAFRGGRPVTIQLALDAAKILAGIDLGRDGNATHSREGDPLAARLKTNIERAFRVVAVKTDAFQDIAVAAPAEAKPAPAGTRPYRLEVSRRLPRMTLPEDNPLTIEGVELGRRLFHESRLSRKNVQSCASCHEPGLAFVDPRRLSPGATGKDGRRNSMPLFNLAWGHAFFWDGRAKTLREQVLMPIEDPREMDEKLDRVMEKLRADPEYPRAFDTAFGPGGVTPERMALALEQFLLTLISQEAKFDRAARKLDTLTEEEKRGLQLFVTEHDPARGLRGADCFHCHGGNLFTSGLFANNGLPPLGSDDGRFEVTGDAQDRGKFKVPSLRNVAITGPYMHDGRFATLEEVVDHYDRGVFRSATLDPNLAKHPATGLGLSVEEKRALVAFLKTLTDGSFVRPSSSPATAQTR